MIHLSVNKSEQGQRVDNSDSLVPGIDFPGLGCGTQAVSKQSGFALVFKANTLPQFSLPWTWIRFVQHPLLLSPWDVSYVPTPSFTHCPVGNNHSALSLRLGMARALRATWIPHLHCWAFPLFFALFYAAFRTKLVFYEKAGCSLWLKKSRLVGNFHDLGQHAHAEASKNSSQNNQSRKIQVWQFSVSCRWAGS